MSCLPQRGEREQRLMRAFHHYVYRNHDLDPAGCAGCREAAGFLTIPGYEGDIEYPVCALVQDDGIIVRDNDASAKYTRGQRWWGGAL